MIPPTKPRISSREVRALLERHAVTDAVAVLGIRGYYGKLFAPAGNNRAVYDDALIIISPEATVSFNGNTDPSAHRSRIASLKPGLWRYKPGIHGLSRPEPQRYPAFVQAGEVTVLRDGVGEDTGWFGINIHRGGNHHTSSLGCQTLPPAQWTAFHALLHDLLKRHSQRTFPYLLLEAGSATATPAPAAAH